jgi:ABC-2 type transport system permease protein
MKAHLICVKNTFLSNSIYRFNVFFRTISVLVSIYIQIAIWKALYANTTGAVETNYGNISLNDMVTYVIMSAVINIITNNSIIPLMDSKIKSGEIAFDINRPFSFFGYLLSITAGNNLFRFIFEFLFIVLIFLPFYSVSFPGFPFFLLFLFSLVLGMMIRFIMAFTLGVLGFWYLRIWHMARVLSVSIGFFSGSFVPIWFFPPVIDSISNFLPFRYIYFLPLSIYLEKINPLAACLSVCMQLLWIGILSMAALLVWQRGIRKLVIQGG